jgi:hypothetical protein
LYVIQKKPLTTVLFAPKAGNFMITSSCNVMGGLFQQPEAFRKTGYILPAEIEEIYQQPHAMVAGPK